MSDPLLGIEKQLEILSTNSERLIETIGRLTAKFEKIVSDKGYLVTAQ